MRFSSLLISSRRTLKLNQIKFFASFAILILYSISLGAIDCPAQLVRIYVSQAATASDANSGSYESPLRTITEALSRVNPGNQILVLPGDYRTEDTGFGIGKIAIQKSGTLAEPIRVVGIGSPKVNGFVIRDVHDIVVSGFNLENSEFDHSRFVSMPTIQLDQPRATLADVDFLRPFSERRDLINAAFRSYFSFVEDLDYSNGFDLKNANRILVRTCKINGYWAGVQLRSCSNITVFRNEISETYYGIFGFSQDELPGLTDSSIRYNTITQSLGAGIDIRSNSTNVVIGLNTIQYSGTSHLRLGDGVSNSLVDRNFLSLGGYYSETMTYPGSSALNLHGAGADNIVKANLVWRQIDLTGVDGNGIILDLLHGFKATVKGNFSALHSGAGVALTESPNAVISNNIFALNGHDNDTYRIGAGVRLARDTDINNVITKNLFWANREAGILGYNVIDLQRQVDHNMYFGSAGVGLIWDGYLEEDRSYKTISEIQESTGWETNGERLTIAPTVKRPDR